MAADLKFYEAKSTQGSLTIGLIVILLYVFFVALVFLGFASYITRTDWDARLESVDEAEKVTGLDGLLFLVERETELDARASVALAEVRSLDLEIDTAQVTFEAKKAEIEAAKQSAHTNFLRTNLLVRKHLVHLEEDYATSVLALIDDAKAPVDSKLEGIAQVLPGVRFRADVPPKTIERAEAEFIRVMTAHAETSASLAKMQAERDTAERLRDSLLLNQSEPKQRLKALRDERAAIEKILPYNSEHRGILKVLSERFYGIIKIWVSYPTIFLTLIVTIAAGGLGSVVSFSRNFFSESEDIGGARLFVNVGEGIAAAVAIFLFSGAGMLVLSQGGGPGGRVELSPYTVAFIAFVSGFMAEDAFRRIQHAGREAFKLPGAGSDGLEEAAPLPGSNATTP